MSETARPVLAGQLVEEQRELTLVELCELCEAQQHQIVELVHEGVLHVERTQVTEWRFRGGSIRRAMTALRLQRDLQLNTAGAALALQLLQEIEELRQQLRRGT